MHSELYVSPDIYQRPFPNFKRPDIVGYMSLDDKRQYHGDCRGLKFVENIPECDVKFDLNLHFDEGKEKFKDLNEKITHLLQYLLERKELFIFTCNNNIETARFFCYRGLLTCIACTPYENQEPWKITATLFNGDIFLCARNTEQKLMRLKNMSQREKQCTYWGYKFEQYILADGPGLQPNANAPLEESGEFSLVFTTSLNNHKMVYPAEMDGIICKGNVSSPPSKDWGVQETIHYLRDKEFIELKTNKHIESPNQQNSFRRFKTKKWWCQSFLTGVETIICGFRNDEGIVEELKEFKIKDLPKMSKRFWNPNVCLNFLDTFMTYVKRCFAKEIRRKHGEAAVKKIQSLPMISLDFEWSPRLPVRVTNVNSCESDPILPEWFTDSFKTPLL